jgi:hypothetical protein
MCSVSLQVKGTAAAVRTPTLVASTITNVKAIAAGNRHSLLLHADGSVRAWGVNSFGELGQGHTSAVTGPELVQLQPAVYLSKAIAIAAGANHSVALSSDGQLVTGGSNQVGQMGTGSTNGVTKTLYATPIAGFSGIQAIYSGAYHLAALEKLI